MDRKQNASRNADWAIIGVAIVLIATGLILVGGDLMGVLSLDRIQNLWPAVLIVIGAIDLFSYGEKPRTATPAVIDKETHAGQLR